MCSHISFKAHYNYILNCGVTMGYPWQKYVATWQYMKSIRALLNVVVYYIQFTSD